MKDAVKDPRSAVRWWPLLLVLLLSALGFAATWLLDFGHQQARVTQTLGVGALSLLGVALWFFFLSRLPARLRLRAALLLALIGGAFLLLFRVRGMSGNLVPILELRFGHGPNLSATSRSAEVEVTPSEFDFAQFRGDAARDGVVSGITLARDWSAEKPREIWRRTVGSGWSGFAVVGQVAITQEQREGQEVVAAYLLETGEPLWSHAVEGAFESPVAGDGPRTTPTVEDGQVFTFGPTGLLRALDLQSGSLSWSRQAAEDNGTEPPTWGYAGSPLVVGELVVVSVGGNGHSLVAYRRRDGEKVWSGGDDGAGYSSPMLATLAGLRQIVIFNQSSVAAHDPQDGSVLWSYPWSANQPNVAQPVVLGENRLLVSSGYGLGSTLLEIVSEDDALTAKEVWHSNQMKVKFSNLVQKDGKLYGLDDGILACLDPATGKRCWKKGRYGHGQVLLVGDLLLLLGESGEMVLIEPNPEDLKELGRFSTFVGKTWNTFALAGSKLLVRSDQEAACFELPLAE